jgi:hypothetical protein
MSIIRVLEYGAPIDPLPPPRSSSPVFLITIDTEGDNLWATPREITTRNAAFLSRFQGLCEKHGLKPSYLTNYEMAQSRVFQEFARGVLARRTAEIGMHLHAWNSPPVRPLTDDDYRYQPYLIEYPEPVIREKVDFLTRLLEDTFGVPIISHRAGRRGMDEVYARILVDRGYRVDCSVSPHVSWRQMKGDPRREGGPDFSDFPEEAYQVDLSDIRRPGTSSLLEVPTTVMRTEKRALSKIGELLPQGTIAARVWNRLFPARLWLKPNGRNLTHMLGMLDRAIREQRRYVQLAFHSSELMPGGSPGFRTNESIEALYRDLERLFSQAAAKFAGATLGEFERTFSMERDRL